jgi:hypothetical protein
MGSEINKDLQPYLSENKLPRKCNIFISEATYNEKDRQFTKKDAIQERELLKNSIIKNTFYNYCLSPTHLSIITTGNLIQT